MDHTSSKSASARASRKGCDDRLFCTSDDYAGSNSKKIKKTFEVSDNVKDLIIVDNMLRTVEEVTLPDTPDSYRAKILGFSTMPASVVPSKLNGLDPGVAAAVIKKEPKNFDAREHLLAWDDIIKGEHVGLVRQRIPGSKFFM